MCCRTGEGLIPLVPSGVLQKLLTWLHADGGHSGLDDLYAAAKKVYYHPALGGAVRRVVRACQICHPKIRHSPGGHPKPVVCYSQRKPYMGAKSRDSEADAERTQTNPEKSDEGQVGQSTVGPVSTPRWLVALRRGGALAARVEHPPIGSEDTDEEEPAVAV